jgi:hypothetical protein
MRRQVDGPVVAALDLGLPGVVRGEVLLIAAVEVAAKAGLLVEHAVLRLVDRITAGDHGVDIRLELPKHECEAHAGDDQGRGNKDGHRDEGAGKLLGEATISRFRSCRHRLSVAPSTHSERLLRYSVTELVGAAPATVTRSPVGWPDESDFASMSFQATLLGWRDFYMIVGTAAASLVGLLFVGLSLHLRVVLTHKDVQALARATFASFGLTLALALFMVAPETQASDLGWELVGLGVVASLLVVRSIVSGIRSSDRTIDYGRLLLRFGITAFTFLGVIATGGVLVTGDASDALGWLFGVSIFLIITSLRNSWDLLVSVGAATIAGSAKPP